MQTSQVSNPANVLSAPAPASKQNDANSGAEPFGKVLSREVADRRNAGETPKPHEKEQVKAAPQQARNDAKPAEAKSTKESKPAKESKPDDSAEATDATESSDATVEATSQISEDLLALVANLAQMKAPGTESSDTTQAAQNTASAADAAATLAAGSAVKVDAPLTTPIANHTQETDTGAQRKSLTALDAMSNRATASKQKDGALTSEKPEPAHATTADLVAKGQELLNGTSEAAATAAGSGTSRTNDFVAAMKESTSAMTAAMQPAQQASLQAVQATAANATEKLTPAVGTPAWDQALGQKVVWMVAGGQQNATMTLNPPDLGPLQVVLNVSNSQANATFIAAQPEVRQALEAAMPRLREMLGEAGIQLGQASVNSGTPNQQGSFDQQASQSSRHTDRHGGRADALGPDAQVRVSRVQPASSGQGLVDTFV